MPRQRPFWKRGIQPGVLISEFYGPIASAIWQGTFKKRGFNARPRHAHVKQHGDGPPCECVAFRLADLYWQHNAAALKPVWDPAVKKRHMSGYELFMKEAVYIVQQVNRLPACPSISGGYSCKNVTPSETVPPWGEQTFGRYTPPQPPTDLVCCADAGNNWTVKSRAECAAQGGDAISDTGVCPEPIILDRWYCVTALVYPPPPLCRYYSTTRAAKSAKVVISGLPPLVADWNGTFTWPWADPARCSDGLSGLIVYGEPRGEVGATIGAGGTGMVEVGLGSPWANQTFNGPAEPDVETEIPLNPNQSGGNFRDCDLSNARCLFTLTTDPAPTACAYTPIYGYKFVQRGSDLPPLYRCIEDPPGTFTRYTPSEETWADEWEGYWPCLYE